MNKEVIKFNQTLFKKNSSTCEINEYIFNRPNLGIARAKIHGRYPIEQGKKNVNNKCDIIYFVLGGSGVVYTENGEFKLEKYDALFLSCGKLYWVEGNNFEVLVISSPEWYVEQYKEI